MKVYIVIEFHNYQGYDEPFGVFFDKEKAERCAKEMDDGAREARVHSLSVCLLTAGSGCAILEE
jgi:hypothetical protein